MSYIAYYRVSTKKQGDSGLGLGAQRSCVSDYLEKAGTRLLAEFTEVESGTKSDRPELDRALRECKLTNSKLIIAKLDRLSRNVHFLTGLQRSGVEFVCCDMPDANNVTVQLMAVLAENEARNISIKTKEALKQAKENGVKLGNPRLALVRNTDTSSANKARKNLATEFNDNVGEILKELFLEEGISTYRGLARALNDRAVLTARGQQWSATQVSRVMKHLKSKELI